MPTDEISSAEVLDDALASPALSALDLSPMLFACRISFFLIML